MSARRSYRTDPRNDRSLAQRPPAVCKVVALVGVQLGRAAPWPARTLADRRHGIGPASPAACYRAGWPARSSGRVGCHWHRRGCDAWSPACRNPSGSGQSPRPPFCWNAGAVHRRTIPVDGVGIAEPVEQYAMQSLPYPGPMPLVQTPPAGHPRAAAHLLDDRPQGVGNKRGCHAPTNRSRPVLLRTLIVLGKPPHSEHVCSGGGVLQRGEQGKRSHQACW
jgi:hypothetical protein